MARKNRAPHACCRSSWTEKCTTRAHARTTSTTGVPPPPTTTRITREVFVAKVGSVFVSSVLFDFIVRIFSMTLTVSRPNRGYSNVYLQWGREAFAVSNRLRHLDPICRRNRDRWLLWQTVSFGFLFFQSSKLCFLFTQSEVLFVA